jgi:phosphotransferase system enzyme I (PtsI)
VERLNGIGVSPGIAVGRAAILTLRTEAMRFPIQPDRVEREIALLQAAREHSRHQLQDIRERIAKARGGELAAIFDAQILMLDDPSLVGRAEQIVREEHVNAAWAVHRTYEELGAIFSSFEDEYLREREHDVADVAGRLRLNLRHGARGPRELLSELEGPSILLADELTASLAAQLDWSRIQGFAVDAGSRTYHTAILARSLKVPAIVGLHDASARVPAGTTVILDGASGELAINPGPDAIDRAHRLADRPRPRVSTSSGLRHGGEPAATSDGLSVRLQANVELLEDLQLLREHGAEGVGLYRSEFMLSGRSLASTTEDAQYALYRSLVEQVAPQPVTVRTFDLDERQIGLRVPDRRRGRAGLRGLRLGLAHPDIMRTQLRALVRASVHGRLRVMFPFVTGIEEIRGAKAMLAEITRELQVAAPAVGAMVEVPAAALASDLLAPEVDFLTIGTNDLIQYCLAVDRTDDRVSDLYEPLHPAVLRLIRLVRRAAARHRTPVSLCGEMASDPALIGLLVGLGLTDFSMTPAAIPTVRQAIRDLRADHARALASHALTLPTAEAIEKFLFDELAARNAAR